MLNDRDLESALQRYRVSDPPGDLGAAIVASALDRGGRFEWVWGPAAAAAVLAVWVGYHVLPIESPVDPVRAQEVAIVTEILGGGEAAAAYAEIVVPVSAKEDPLMALMLPEDPWQQN